MLGLWKDSTQMIYGGNGHTGSGGYGPACDFMFLGIQIPLTGESAVPHQMVLFTGQKKRHKIIRQTAGEFLLPGQLHLNREISRISTLLFHGPAIINHRTPMHL